MRVLFVYKYLSLGGVESVLRTRLRHLDSLGVSASCWFLHDLGGTSVFGGLESRIRVGPVESLAQELRSERIDLVSSIDTEEILPLYDRPELPPLILEAHSAYPATLEIWRHLDNRVRAVFVPSRHHAETLVRIVGSEVRIRVVPNIVGNRFLGPLMTPSTPPIHPIVAWVGRLDDHKNWKLFLEIAGAVSNSSEDPEFWVVGKPVDHDLGLQLYRRAKQVAVLPRLRWLNGLDHYRVPRLFDLVRASGGVAVTTSRAESFGMTVVEAMARACAVVVPDSGPFTEFVEDGRSGLVYAPESAADAGKKIRAALDPNLGRRLGEQARQTVQERFSPEFGAALLARELHQLLAE